MNQVPGGLEYCKGVYLRVRVRSGSGEVQDVVCQVIQEERVAREGSRKEESCCKMLGKSFFLEFLKKWH